MNKLVGIRTEKRCPRCRIIKKSSEFYANATQSDKLLVLCKECFRIYIKKYRLEHKKEVYQAKRRFLKRNPHKKKAWRKVEYFVKAKLIEKEPCEICGEKAHAHHDDYSKPLDIRWLCNTHHKQIHNTKKLEVIHA